MSTTQMQTKENTQDVLQFIFFQMHLYSNLCLDKL